MPNDGGSSSKRLLQAGKLREALGEGRPAIGGIIFSGPLRDKWLAFKTVVNRRRMPKLANLVVCWNISYNGELLEFLNLVECRGLF